jgi:hypothetical protein
VRCGRGSQEERADSHWPHLPGPQSGVVHWMRCDAQSIDLGRPIFYLLINGKLSLNFLPTSKLVGPSCKKKKLVGPARLMDEDCCKWNNFCVGVVVLLNE